MHLLQLQKLEVTLQAWSCRGTISWWQTSLGCHRCAGDTLEKDTKGKKGIIGAQSRGNHNVFTHYPKDPNCEVCKKTKATRARFWIKPKKRVYGIAPSTQFGDLITAGHKIQNVENGLRCGHKRCNPARWLFELDPELSDGNKRNIGNNVVFTKISFCVTEAGKNLHTQFQRVFFKPVKIDNGIITQAPLVPQKRREWQKEPSVQWKKEQRSHQCKVDCQKKGVTVRWNAIVTCATCTIKWPMARQHSRKDMVSNLTDHPCQETMIAGYDGLRESEASDINVRIFRSEELFVKGDCEQGRHRQQTETLTKKMMLKSKKATKREATHEVRGPWVENIFLHLMKKFVWSFTTLIMEHSRSHWNTLM